MIYPPIAGPVLARFKCRASGPNSRMAAMPVALWLLRSAREGIVFRPLAWARLSKSRFYRKEQRTPILSAWAEFNRRNKIGGEILPRSIARQVVGRIFVVRVVIHAVMSSIHGKSAKWIFWATARQPCVFR